MPLSLNDQPLLLPDPEGALSAWLNEYLSVEGWKLFGGEPTARRSARTGTRGENVSGVGLPIPNYPPDPPPKLNCFRWPSGAARWAHGVVLMTGETFRALTPSLDEPLALKIDDEAHSVTLPLYALDAKQINWGADSTTSAGETELYVVALVDARYRWQFVDSGTQLSLLSDAATLGTWDQLLDLLASALGVTLTKSTVDPRYLAPDAVEFFRQYSSVPLLLDAAAHSIGHRIVVEIGGTVRSQSAADALTVQAENGLLDRRISGDDRARPTATLCEECTTTFPRYVAGELNERGERYAVTQLTGGGLPLKLVLHSTCRADFAAEGDSAPRNWCRLNDLCTANGEAYFQWNNRRYDLTYAGVKEWRHSGLDDACEWLFGAQTADQRYQCQTRVQSLPLDFGVEQGLQQDACPLLTATTSTSSTTSTSTSTETPCSGTCHWTWFGSYWNPDSNTCTKASTTSSSSTTSTTTTSSTSTPDPCRCPTTTSSSTTSTSTTSTSTTTTVQPYCQCEPPTYSGTFTQECTVTYCVRKLCDCATTTTSTTAAPCSGGTCTVAGFGFGASFEYVITPCVDPNCHCDVKLVAPCATYPVTRNCVAATTPPPLPPGHCVGSCQWFCQQSYDHSGLVWYLINDCTGPAYLNCGCEEPSAPCEECNSMVFTGCKPTSADCGHCYTTSTSSTSTTAGPCAGVCAFKWDGAVWQALTNTCPEGTCVCAAPAYEGSAECETVRTVCGPPSTTTTSTTTTPCPATSCLFYCRDGALQATEPQCTSPCHCTAFYPSSGVQGDPCSPDNALYVGFCGPTSTSTSSSSSTSSTTTCAPCGTPASGTGFYFQCSRGGNWEIRNGSCYPPGSFEYPSDLTCIAAGEMGANTCECILQPCTTSTSTSSTSSTSSTTCEPTCGLVCAFGHWTAVEPECNHCPPCIAYDDAAAAWVAPGSPCDNGPLSFPYRHLTGACGTTTPAP